MASAVAQTIQSAPPSNSCVVCHEDSWDEMRGSIHAQHAITCDRCHGGDPTKEDMDEAKAPTTGFIGVPDKRKIVEMCGSCHADVETMNFYGTRTDQLARYRTSHHGKKLLLEGDTSVAACTDCHGAHDIVKVNDPQSRVHPLNLPGTCAKCHADEKLMSRHGLPSDVFNQYQSSVHGQALFEKKDFSVAHCAACHGSHGAVPPGVKEVADTCGKCHLNEKKYFLESPHARLVSLEATLNGGLPNTNERAVETKPLTGRAQENQFSECVSCHGNHAVKPGAPHLYDEACLKCHEPPSGAYQTGQKIKRALERSQTLLGRARSLVEQASIEGIFVEDETALLEQAKTSFIEMAPLQHALSHERISALEEKTASLSKEIEDGLARKRRVLKQRRFMLIPIWIFIFVIALALWLKYKKLTKKGSHDPTT